MQMELNIEEVKKTDIKMVRDDLNSIMGIFMMGHFDKENEKVLENALSIKKEWLMRVNGKMIKEPVMGNLPIKMVKLNKVDLMKISTLVNNKTSLNTPN